MKKVLAAVLVMVMCLGCLTACSSASKQTKVIQIDLTSEEYAFGVDKDQPELLEKVNTFISEIMSNGKFEEICNHYFGDGTPVEVTSATLDTSKDQLVIATNAGFEPFEYTKGDKYLGIDMEIAAALAEYLGQELVISNMDFDAVCLSVGQHKCDIAMAGLTVKPDREEYVTFSTSYYNASQRVICMEDCKDFDSFKTADDVAAFLATKDKNTKIGVQTGTTGEFYVRGDESWGFDGFETSCVGYKNGSLAVQDMVNGNINYVIIDSAPAKCVSEAINAMNK